MDLGRGVIRHRQGLLQNKELLVSTRPGECFGNLMSGRFTGWVVPLGQLHGVTLPCNDGPQAARRR
jgi:hypothetical protein